MFSDTTSRSKHFTTKTTGRIVNRKQRFRTNIRAIIESFICNCIGKSLLLFYYITSMSMFYQVMGAVRCPKIKKHPGLKLRPINKAKEPFMPNDMLIYSCESAEYTQSIKCLDDGRWSELPHCPDPSNFTCPNLPPLAHGVSNSTGPPYKVGSVVAFKCDTESFPNLPSLPSTFPTTQTPAIPTTTKATTITTTQYNNLSSETLLQRQPLRYNLTGHRLLKCLPSSKWNHPMPTCSPVYPEPPSQVGLVLTTTILILVPILILIVIAQLFIRWRKRQQQRERWKQYFTDYKYRHSKTSITFGTRPNSNASTIPVTDL